MAIAHKCDRCGKFYENNSKKALSIMSPIFAIAPVYLSGIKLLGDDGEEHECFDFCDDCVNEFDIFMNGGNNNE